MDWKSEDSPVAALQVIHGRHHVTLNPRKRLRVLTPSEGLFAIVRDMFKDAWDQIAAHGSFARETLEQQLRKADKQADKLLDLIVSTDSPRLVSSYETRLNALESEKCLLQEKLATVAHLSALFCSLRRLAENDRSSCVWWIS